MSLTKVVENLVDSALERLRQVLDDYTSALKEDLETFVTRLVKKVVKAMAVGVMGASLLAVGSIFALVGFIRYLSAVIGPAAAWGAVGLVMMVGGGGMLFLLWHMMRPAKPAATRRRHA